MSKTRVLFVGEASPLSTGFAVVSREIIGRIHSHWADRIVPGEFGCYLPQGDPREWTIPWEFYNNSPETREQAEFDSDRLNQFGKWKLDAAIAHFKPDIVFSARDPWMDGIIQESAFRGRFHWSHMPPVDSAPLKDSWMDTYANCDSLHAYAPFGKSVLESQSSGRLCVSGVATPGVDDEALCPVRDKVAHKRSLGLPDDAKVIGFVGRNQRRKLFPDLIETFDAACAMRPEWPLYLWLHVAYPDVGWDIADLVRRSPNASRIYFTYHCQACGAIQGAPFQYHCSTCRHCGANQAMLPGPGNGVPAGAMAVVYGAMDIYAQYSVCEGLGVPLLEAASCGVPVGGVDYSATSDMVKAFDGLLFPVQRFFHDVDTGASRALPDCRDSAEMLVGFLSLPESVRLARGAFARGVVRRQFRHGTCGDTLGAHFVSVGSVGNWSGPPRYFTPPPIIPAEVAQAPDYDFVGWCLTHVAGTPERVGSYTHTKLARDLSWGRTGVTEAGGMNLHDFSAFGMGHEGVPFNRQDLVRMCQFTTQRRNEAESRLARGVS